jgi:hypothetical protein
MVIININMRGVTVVANAQRVFYVKQDGKRTKEIGKSLFIRKEFYALFA